MATKYLDSTGLSYLWGKIKTYLSTNYQAKLTSGTNIKTINNTSLLGSGNIDVSGGGGGGNYVDKTTPKIDLDTSEALYTAIDALGWTSDVIV